jgi:hypothetical protein
MCFLGVSGFYNSYVQTNIEIGGTVELDRGLYLLRASTTAVEDWALLYSAYEEAVICGRSSTYHGVSFSLKHALDKIVITNTSGKRLSLQYKKLLTI